MADTVGLRGNRAWCRDVQVRSHEAWGILESRAPRVNPSTPWGGIVPKLPFGELLS